MDASSLKPDAMLERAVQGAHETVDRLAEAAAPTAEHLTAAIEGAGAELSAQADDALALQREWTDALRVAVREHPIAAVLGAAAVGVLLSKALSR